MSDEPLVSVLIPCWGCRPFIRETIESALSQSYANIEVIVVEDCGQDGTFEEAQSIEHPKLKVVRNERNYGQYGNKNQALKLAQGELIGFLDGDDVLYPSAVEVLHSAWRESGKRAAVVFGESVVIDEDSVEQGRPRQWGARGLFRGTDVLEHLLQMRQGGSHFGNVSPHLFERTALESIGGFPSNNAGPGDQETYFRLLANFDVWFEPVATVKYRVRSGSMSMRTFGLRECADYITMVDRLEPEFRQKESLPPRLRSTRFFDQWRIWAGSHVLLPSLQHKLRRKPNQFDDIIELYVDRGLGIPLCKSFPVLGYQYLSRWFRGRVRRRLGFCRAPRSHESIHGEERDSVRRRV